MSTAGLAEGSLSSPPHPWTETIMRQTMKQPEVKAKRAAVDRNRPTGSNEFSNEFSTDVITLTESLERPKPYNRIHKKTAPRMPPRPGFLGPGAGAGCWRGAGR